MNKDMIKNILLIIMVLVIVIGGSFFASELQRNDNNQEVINEEVYVSIGINDHLNYKANDEKKIIYIARPTCSACERQNPILKEVVKKYNLEVNYLNTDSLTKDEHSMLISSDEYFNEGYGTPLLLVVANNKIVDYNEGLTQEEDLITFFKNNGFISE